jgi:hypothetical protein
VIFLVYLWVKHRLNDIRQAAAPKPRPTVRRLCGVCGGRGCGFCGLSGWS